MRETVHVKEHDTERVTNPSGWTFWRVSSGCIRVQKGDFTAYLQSDEAQELADFINTSGDNEGCCAMGCPYNKEGHEVYPVDHPFSVSNDLTRGDEA